DTGQALALIRHANPQREHFDTSWTISICVGAAVAAMVAAAAPMAMVIFNEPRAVPVILFLSLRPLIAGFEHIGILKFRREFDFQSEFIYLLMQKFFPFVILLCGAFIFENYWAFPVGLVVGRALSVAFSFWLHPYRPRLSLSKIGELWNYSLWMVVVSLGESFASRIDEIFVGRFFGTREMGLYNVGLDLAS